MPNYRRPRVPGATIFFTVCLADPGSDLLLRHVDTLREAVRQARVSKGFEIQAWVTLPDHFHAILTLAPRDSDYPNIIGFIKAQFSREVRRAGFIPPSQGQSRSGYTPTPTPNPGGGMNPALRKGDAGIWQKRYWEHHIRSREEFHRLISYCNHNPVRHGLVRDPFDWPYSSIHRDMRIALRKGLAAHGRDHGEPRPYGKRRNWPTERPRTLSPAPASR